MASGIKSRATAIACALILAGIILRLMPHVANFAPVGAIALFGGAVLNKKLAWWLPLAIMVVSDFIIGLHSAILFTWGGFLLIGLFGMLLRNKNNLQRVCLGTLGSGIIFYVISNFGVWAVSGMYQHTLQGLLDCYIAAIPFFRTSLAADLLYSAALFGAYALATQPASQQAVTFTNVN